MQILSESAPARVQRRSGAARHPLLSACAVLAAAIVWSLWQLRRHMQRRQAAEQALSSEHAFRKAMEDSLNTGMRARDLDGCITYVNPAFCRMVGWSAEELVGWCKERLAAYKYPRIVEIVDSLPMTATGKILKRELH